jgi:hypothetical protein
MPYHRQMGPYSLELVGRASEEKKVGVRQMVSFTCTNGEVFSFFRPNTSLPIPPGKITRVWVKRLDKGDEQMCIHWEEL